MKRTGFVVAMLLLATASPASAANNFQVKDATATTITKCSVQQLDGSQADCNTLVDISGAKINPATKESVAAVASAITALGTPLQQGASVGIAGSLPAFATTPTVNIGTLGGAATEATLNQVRTAIAALFQAGGKVDTVLTSAATNRSAVIGFNATASAASSASTTLAVAVTSAFTNQAGVVSGIPMVGQIVAGTGITTGTTITAVTGSAGSYTLTLSAAATVASGATISSAGPQTIMAANASRRGFAMQDQGSGACYINGQGTATLGPDSLQVPAGGYYDTSPIHTGTGTLSIICPPTSSATGVYGREF